MLVYYNNALNTNTKKRDRSAKTKWILHEYTLPEAHNMSSNGHKIWKSWIGNFDYCMDMIKELHDEVYDVDGNSELEIDEQPFPKRVKY
ncbi:hypothetical protein Sjap_008296 [Stephania japonica]|uniref:Uncharacterized protein n=1 Tax=Stephania japonica TaxID=461633 RepID=A0AAP0JRL4_9MAGN